MRFDYLHIHDNRPLTDWEMECMAHLKSIMLPVDTYTLLELPHYETIVDTVNASDRMRFDWLAEHPHGVYIDTDCKLLYRWKPSKKMPCFPISPSERIPDIFLVYVNGCAGYFRRNFSAHKREQFLLRNPDRDVNAFYGWPYELLKKLTGIEVAPGDCWEHKWTSTNNEIQRRAGMSTIETAMQQQQQSRPVNDVVNEHIAYMSEITTNMTAANQRIIFEMRNMINQQSEEIKKLSARVAEIAKKE